MKIGLGNAPHYSWGAGCDGYVLSRTAELAVILEQMPPNTSEVRHYHARARQFFFVLSGQLTMEMEGVIHIIPSRCGIEIPPNAKHQARNNSIKKVEFLVISSPPTCEDRLECSECSRLTHANQQ